MAYIIVEKGNPRDIGKKLALGENTIIIGRVSPEGVPDMGLNDNIVSRQHAEISFHQDCFKMRDLESTNGTSIDGIRIKPGILYKLSHDSIIGLGIAPEGARVVMRFKDNPTFSTARIPQNEMTIISWIKVDERRREIWVHQKLLTLSPKEYNLLFFLYKKAGSVCQRDELILEVWPEVTDPGGVSDAAIDQLIHRIRLKIETDPARPSYLVSKKGFGYMLVL